MATTSIPHDTLRNRKRTIRLWYGFLSYCDTLKDLIEFRFEVMPYSKLFFVLTYLTISFFECLTNAPWGMAVFVIGLVLFPLWLILPFLLTWLISVVQKH